MKEVVVNQWWGSLSMNSGKHTCVRIWTAVRAAAATTGSVIFLPFFGQYESNISIKQLLQKNGRRIIKWSLPLLDSSAFSAFSNVKKSFMLQMFEIRTRHWFFSPCLCQSASLFLAIYLCDLLSGGALLHLHLINNGEERGEGVN